MRRIVCQLASFALVLNALSIGSPFAFGAYSFINVADTYTPAPSGIFAGFRPTPAIGSEVAAFIGADSGGLGIFTGYGGAITTIAKAGDPAPFGAFVNFGTPAKLDRVAFHGTYLTYSNGFIIGSGIFLGSGGSLTVIAKTGDAAPSNTFTGFGYPAMYDAAAVGIFDPNTVAFVGSYKDGSRNASGIFIGSDGTLKTVLRTGDTAPSGTFWAFGGPDISVAYRGCCTPVPVVAFRGLYGSEEGIFTMTNGELTTIATKSTLPAQSFDNPVIFENSVAFLINADVTPLALPPQAVWSNYSGSLEQIVAEGDAAPVGTFTRFGAPAITDRGIAFEAAYAAGAAKGIFTRFGYAGSGYLGPVESIIKTGDSLFGSQVTTVGMMRFGGQSNRRGRDALTVGDFAFSYSLTDGRQGIALALAVPEPATIYMILIALLATSCHRSCRGHRPIRQYELQRNPIWIMITNRSRAP